MGGEHRYHIRWKESFHLREPALESIRYSVSWRVSPDGNSIVLEKPMESYGQHEIKLLRFALDPEDLAENIFSQLDTRTRETLAVSLLRLYGPKELVASLFT
mgnify:CR=1 FL=1